MLNDECKYNKLINANDLLDLIYNIDPGDVFDCDRISISKIKELIINLPSIDPTKYSKFKINDRVQIDRFYGEYFNIKSIEYTEGAYIYTIQMVYRHEAIFDNIAEDRITLIHRNK